MALFPDFLSSRRFALLCALVVALGFALYTDHVWEDYYITYRSSKNLATGHGLVFNHGEKLHTFTSPLGVLLPAAASLLTGNSSDTAALWIFRVMCATALGGGVAILLALARRHGLAGLALLLPAAALLTDVKTIDFTINGMETAFMVLFLAYTLWAHFTPGPRQRLHLGAAWAGLMWTRPDSFIYVGLLAAGVWLFNEPERTGGNRRQQLALFVRAGLVTSLLYLPWLVWAWGYYGTPIPHTIMAKGGLGEPHTLTGLLQAVFALPWLAWFRTSSLELTFLPSYYMIGGWPAGLVVASRALATLCALLWLLPRLPAWARAASFAFYGAHVYLTFFPYFPFPWYIPSTTCLALVALGGFLHALAGRDRPWLRAATGLLAAGLLAANGWMLWEVARQVRAQQTLVEDGTRRRIGEWLHAQAAPGDAVFMEPLGYIGFFSGLKTYDWPGMSSAEMVAARKESGNNWGAILKNLRPAWIVLRPFEVVRIEREEPGLLTTAYEIAQVFDRSTEVAALTVYGRRYLEHDAHFIVYRRLKQNFGPEVVLGVQHQFGTDVSVRSIDNTWVRLVHASGTMSVRVPAGATRFTVKFGYPPDAYAEDPKTDGATFSVVWEDGPGPRMLAERTLDPANVPADRGLQVFSGDLPPSSSGRSRLLLHTKAGATTNKDWTCWGVCTFE